MRIDRWSETSACPISTCRNFIGSVISRGCIGAALKADDRIHPVEQIAR